MDVPSSTHHCDFFCSYSCKILQIHLFKIIYDKLMTKLERRIHKLVIFSLYIVFIPVDNSWVNREKDQ